MYKLFRLGLPGIIFCITTFAAEPAPVQPWAAGAFNLESGFLWEIGTGTTIPYRLAPTQFSWRSAEFWGHEFSDGSRIVLRHRLSLLGTWIEHGPEHVYLGVAGSPSLELWNKAGTWSAYFGSGGGAGIIDSQGVKGGMGQDLTLNWFIRGGLEHVTPKHVHLTAGIMYQHMSNGGMTKPNPGIDALGFMLGYSWTY